MNPVTLFVVAGFVILFLYILNSIKILREYERGVIYRLGHLQKEAKGPGVILVFAPVDKIVRVDLRQQALEVPPQDIITRDNVTLKVNAVIYWRVMNAPQAVNEVQNYYWQTQQFAQTTLRSVLGEVELDELLAHRDKLNARIQSILDQHTAPFGVKVSNVEVKQVDLPDSMLRAMAKQAEAERENAPRSSTRKVNSLRRSAFRKRPTFFPVSPLRSSCATCKRSPKSAWKRTPPSSSPCRWISSLPSPRPWTPWAESNRKK